MMGPSTRQLRVSEEIKRILGKIFTRNEFYDPDLSGVYISLTEVSISPDLCHATVFITLLNEQHDIDTVLTGLERIAPWLRKQLSKKVRLRVVPTLHFKSDNSSENYEKIEKILGSDNVQRDLD